MSNVSEWQPRQTSLPITIASGASITTVVDGSGVPLNDMYGTNLVALIMPAIWTAASVTFQVSIDNTNFYNLYNPDGTEYVVVAVSGHCVTLDPEDFAAFRFLKIRSGTSGSPVNQGQDSILTLITRPMF